MQCSEISLHCVMLLALLGFLEFPLFLCWSHFTQDTRRSTGNKLQVSHRGSTIHILEESEINLPYWVTLTWGSWSSCSGFVRLLLAGMCGWCVSWLLSTVLVVSLGWPQPGSGRGPGQSDVIPSFIGSHRSRLCMPPRISHTHTAPFANPATHSSLSAIIYTVQASNTHIHMSASVVCFVSLTASAQSSLELWACRGRTETTLVTRERSCFNEK